MLFVLSVHVKNIKTGSEVVQVLHSWGSHDLCLQRAGELSLSGHLPVGPEGQAIFISTSPRGHHAFPRAWNWSKCFPALTEVGQGTSLMLPYRQVPRNATPIDRHQPSCSHASESNLQFSAAGKLLVLRLGRPVLFTATCTLRPWVCTFQLSRH